MGAGDSSVCLSSVCVHFVECIVTLSSGDVLKHRECGMQIDMVKVVRNHVQSLGMFVLQSTDGIMQLL